MRSMCSEAVVRHDLNGPTMGTRWHVQAVVPEGVAVASLRAALQAAVDRVDAQMSLWTPESDLNRLNRAEVGVWVPLPPEIMRVLTRALEIGRASGGAFDIAVADAVTAWGFGPGAVDQARIAALLASPSRARAVQTLELDGGRARKRGEARFDLGGIAKGYGVDRLVDVALAHGVQGLTAGIDGDLRCVGTRDDGAPWPIAIEAPEYDRREVYTMVELSDLAVATSGDYRHWVDLGTTRLAHTIHPELSAPLQDSPASVTVLAADCMTADAWATALMVLGETKGMVIARANGLQAMFLRRPPLV